MTITFRQRSHVITATTTYRAHQFQVDGYADDTQTCRVETVDGTLVRSFHDVQLAELSGRVWRVEAIDDVSGEPVLLRVHKSCACESPAEYATAVWDVPQ